MKKWENPELMILGVENTKEEEIDIMDEEARKKCVLCGQGIHLGRPCKPGNENPTFS